MKKNFLILLLALAFVTPVLAQSTEPDKRSKKEVRRDRISLISKQEEEGVIKYRKHTVVGGKLLTDGYGGFLEISRAQSVKKALLFQLDISERKDTKEEKQRVADFYSTPLIYGKLNFFYPIKLGVQQQFLLGNKGNKNGVGVTANAGGGISLGVLRAYEIELEKNGDRTWVTYASDSALWINSSNDHTAAGPSLFHGWDHITMTPGLYAKTALRFDYGKFNEMVNAIEVGLTGEFYSKKIPQMLYQKQKQFFFSAYVALMFGRRK